MTENATTPTPKDAVASLAALAERLAAATTAARTAAEALDEAARTAAQTDVDAIVAEGRVHVKIITDKDMRDIRVQTLIKAAGDGLTPSQVKTIATAVRVSSGDTITLPKGKYEDLSRGKGWARLGAGSNAAGSNATWGDRVDDGYSVSVEGNWTVGSTDGYNRKESTPWKVSRVGKYWIAN